MRKPDIERPHQVGNGIHRLYRFKNDYGASVVRFSIGVFGGSYGAEKGLWELAVIKFKGKGFDNFVIKYDTPITDDVVGHLTDKAVDNLLTKIEALPE